MPRHLMDDQEDMSVNRHSVGIVENPLYTENDDFDFAPTYATLNAKQKKKEKEAEAEVRTQYRAVAITSISLRVYKLLWISLFAG